MFCPFSKDARFVAVGLLGWFIGLVPAMAQPNGKPSLDAQLSAIHDSIYALMYSDVDRANRVLDRGTALIVSGGNRVGTATRAMHHRMQGVLQMRQAQYVPAQQHFTESINLYGQVNDSFNISIVYGDYANIFNELKQFDKAEYYFKESARIKRNLKKYNALANTLANSASVYFYSGQYEKILPVLAEALAATKIAGDTALMISIYTNRIQTFFKFEEPDKAADDIRELEEVATKANHTTGLAQVMFYKGYVAKVNGKYAEANEYYTKSLTYFTKLKNIYRQRDIRHAIAENAAQINDYKTSYENELIVKDLNDSIYGVKQEKTINELNIKYETEKKEARLRQQMAELELAGLREREATNELTQRGLLLKTREQELAAADLRNQQARLEAERNDARIAQQKAELATARQRQTGLMIGFAVVALLLGLLARQFWLTRKTNRALASSNQQIELMLRELHHRVKNNLQIVSSLFRLQARRTADSATASVLREGQARVDAMSILHQQLYQNEAVTNIDLQVYLETLLEKLQFAYGFADRPFAAAITVQPAEIDVDKALPIGLIMNELFTNSFKYAFAATESPRIEIRIDPHQVVYHDNGTGLPESFDPQQATSFGMRLIGSFSQQLKGQYSFANEGGLKFTLRF